MSHGILHGPSKLLFSQAASVNLWFFIAVPFGGGYWYKAECEMLPGKIDGEMNVQIRGFFVSCHGLAPSFFEEMTHCRCQKHRRRSPGNPNGPLKFRKYRVYLSLLRLFTSARSRLLFHGSGSCYAPASSYFEQMAHCRHQNFTGADQANLKVDRNSALCLFTFTRSQLMLRFCG